LYDVPPVPLPVPDAPPVPALAWLSPPLPPLAVRPTLLNVKLDALPFEPLFSVEDNAPAPPAPTTTLYEDPGVTA
jgi:hypothetical protein